MMKTAATIQPRIFDVRGTSQYTGWSVRTIYNLIGNGELQVCRVGRTVRIDREDIDALIERAKRERVQTQ